MKGKKCIKFLTFFITLVLSFVLFSNDTSAVDNITNLRQGFIQKINFNTYTPNNTYTDQPITNYVYSNLYTATINSGNVFRISSLVINTYGSLAYNKNDKWDLTIYIYTSTNAYRGLGGETLIPTVLCPTFTSSDNVIDNCNIEYHDIIDSPIDINNLGNNEYGIQNKIHGYYAIKLNGHFTNNGSGNAMNIQGQLMVIKNVAALELDVKYLFGFSPLRIYKETSAEEEMNEKDEEDRSNIESQSSDTDTEANEQGNEATQTGTSLFGAFTQLLGALTNVNATSCTLPAMQVYTLNLGNMNLCQYDIPPQIMALVSIGMVFIIIPLGINLVKRMISLYKEITG